MGLACGGASAQGPQARPRAPQASRGLGTNLALATATLTPRQARRLGPRREGRAWEETPTPRGQDAQTREAAGCGSAGVAPEALARVACRGRERGRMASPAKQGSSRCRQTANVGVKTKQEKPSQEPPPRSQPGAAPPRPVRQTGADKRVSFVRTANLEASGSVSSVSARPSLAGGSRPQLPGALLLRIRK